MNAGPSCPTKWEARERTRAAIRMLCADPNLQAVVLDREVRDRATPAPALHFAVYQVTAEAAGFRLLTQVRPHRQGYEHELTMVRHANDKISPSYVKPVTDEEILHRKSIVI